MLKKIIIPTALAGALFTVGQTASANEVDFDKLAQQARIMMQLLMNNLSKRELMIITLLEIT